MSNLTVSSAVDTLMAASDIAGLRAALALTTIPLVNSTNAAASAPPVSITGSWFSGGSAMTTKPQLLIEAAGATSTGWATAGTGLGVNAASGFLGNLADFQVNGVSVFKVSSAGVVTANYSTNGKFGVGNSILKNGGLDFQAAGDTINFFDGSGNADLKVLRDTAGTLCLRNGANAQTLNIYESYTSGSVLSRMFARYSVANSRYEIGTEHVGASARDLTLMTGGSVRLTIAASTNTITLPDNGTLIGGSGGVFRFRYWNTPSNSATVFDSSSDTILTFANSQTTPRMCWAGTTSSFPSLKRSSAVLQARLADDSDFATFQGKLQTAANAVAETPTATHTLLLRDAAGTIYKVLAVAA